MTTRSPAIDVLRAAAVLLVLGRHLDVCPEATSPWLHALTAVWNRGGWMGVDLFFVLSGFLISGLLFKEHQQHGAISFPRFFVRRGFKIYPAFWVMILATVVLRWGTGLPVRSSNLAAELLFVQSYFPGLWNHTWSLAVEEHFYILLPVLLIALCRLSRRPDRVFRPLPWIFAVIAILCLAARLHRAWAFAFQTEADVFPTHLRIDSLFFGVFCSYLCHYGPDWLRHLNRWQITLLIGGGVALLVPAFVWELDRCPYLYSVGFTQLYLGSGLILMGMIPCDLGTTLPVRALAFIGSRSYSIYLWHMLVNRSLARSMGTEHWLAFAGLYLAGAIAGGLGMAALVEYPVLALRDRLFPSRSRAI